MVTGETKSILSLESPILITVCKVNQFDQTNKIGYKGENAYYRGKTIQNKTFISWTGLEGNLTANETKTNLFVSDIERMWLDKKTGNISPKTHTVLPNGQCQQFEGPPHRLLSSKEGWKNYISIYLVGKMEDSVYYAFVSDPAAAPEYQLPKPLLNGDRMEATTANYSKLYYYNIVLTERQVELDDGSCVDYPDANGHKSYADCVEEENQRKILPVLGCMPPWLSDRSPCNKPFLKTTDEHEQTQQWITNILTRSKTGYHYEAESCTRPCTQISVHTTFQDVVHYTNPKFQLRFNLFFDETIKVERVVLAYGTIDLLVEVGSCLGLWLGLSVVGIFDIGVLVCVKFRNIKSHVDCWRQSSGSSDESLKSVKNAFVSDADGVETPIEI